MSLAIFYKLLAIFVTVALGWGAGRMRWLGDNDPARVLANAALYIFIPALLFRTTSRIDFTSLPWRTLAAFFGPVLPLLLAVYLWQRRRSRRCNESAAAPSVRAISATFGNTVQVGIPVAAALFGETGLGIHITIIGLHALTLLSVSTTLVELDLARARARHRGVESSLATTLQTTLRNTIIHPVVLPVLAGLACNASGYKLPPVIDEVLELLGTAVVPLCLVLIGMSLAYYGLQGRAMGAVVLSLLKLVALPALVLGAAHWGLGLDGVALAVVVMAAALPIGSNALIFSQRYGTLEAEATAAIVLSTLGYVATAPLWLLVLRLLDAP